MCSALIRHRHLTGDEVEQLLGEVRTAPPQVRGRRVTAVVHEREEFLSRMESRIRAGVAGPRPRVTFRGRDLTDELQRRVA
jgi:hypothetical protein